MPRYFFHLRSDVTWSPDPSGQLLPDMRAVVEEALKAVRLLLRAPLTDTPGRWRGWSIQVADESGRIVFALPFESVAALRSEPGDDTPGHRSTLKVVT